MLLLPLVSVNVGSLGFLIKFIDIQDVSKILVLLFIFFFLLAHKINLTPKNALFGNEFYVFLCWAGAWCIYNLSLGAYNITQGENLQFSFLFSFIYFLFIKIGFFLFASRCLLISVSPQIFIRNVKYSYIFVLFVCFFQLQILSGINWFLTDVYDSLIFYILEGRWQGWQGSTNSAEYSLGLRSMSSPMVSLTGRLSGTFQEPSAFAVFLLLFLLPIILNFNYRDLGLGSTWSKRILITITLILILFTKSSTALIGLTIVAFYYYLNKGFSHFKYLFYLIPIVLLLLLTTDLMDVLRIEYLFSKFIDVDSTGSSQTRFGTMAAALSLFLENPLGVGYARHSELLASFIPSWSYNVETLAYIDSNQVVLHNFLMRILVDFGIVGILFIFAPLYTLYSKLRAVSSDSPFNHSTFNSYKYFILTFIVLSFSNINIHEMWFILLLSFYFTMASHNKIIKHFNV